MIRSFSEGLREFVPAWLRVMLDPARAPAGITLVSVRVGKQVHRQLLDFTAQHKEILKYMGVPASVYAALETGG